MIRFPGFPPEPALEPDRGRRTTDCLSSPRRRGSRSSFVGLRPRFSSGSEERRRGRGSAIDERRCCELERRTRADTPGRACRRPSRIVCSEGCAKQMRSASLADAGVGHPLGAGVDRHACLQRHLREPARVDCLRQLHPQEDPAGGNVELGRRPELRAQRLDEDVELAAQGLPQRADVGVEACRGSTPRGPSAPARPDPASLLTPRMRLISGQPATR